MPTMQKMDKDPRDTLAGISVDVQLKKTAKSRARRFSGHLVATLCKNGGYKVGCCYIQIKAKN